MSKTEQKLKESEEKYRLLVENTNAAITLFDENGTYLFLNNIALQWIKSMGLSLEVEDIIDKKNLHDIFSKDVADFFLERIHRIFKSGAEKTIEERVEDLDRWISSNHQPVRDQEGKIIAIQIITQDITKRKKVEQKLKESEEKYRNLVENAQEGVWAVDENNDTIFVNPKICEMLGYTADDMMGKNLDLFLDDSMMELINSYRERREKGLKDTYDLEFMKKDGTMIYTSVKAAPILNENGEFKGSFAYIANITDRKKAEQLIKRRLKVASTVSTISSRFVGIFNIDDAINASLADMGRLSKASRSYLFLFTEDNIMNNTNEWCDEGILPQIDNLQDLPFNMFPWWIRQLESGEFIHIVDVSKMPKEASVEKEILESQDIKSLLVLPFYIGKKLSGFLGFDNVKETGEWREEDFILLRIYSEIIGNAFERKQTDQKLKESEERFRELANSLPQVIGETDGQGNLTFVNNNTYSVYGYTPDDFNKGLNALQMLIPEDRKRAMENIKRVIRGKEEEEMRDNEYTALRKDGSTFPVIVYSNPIIYKDTSVGMRSIIIDITDKKKAEQKLKESEEKYRLITENANDIIAVLDDKFRPEYINETPLNKMLGYNSVDYIGKTDFLVIHPDDRKMVLNGLIKGSEVGEGIADARLRHKDGRYIWVESRGKTFIGRNGEKKILLNIRNITERKKAEKEINNALDEIKRSNAELEQFAYVVSHDLQEPLRMVSGFANLLEKRYKESLDEDAHDFIDFIIDGATRMHNLINDLLAFSRIGTRSKVFKPTDMNVVLEAILNNIRISAIETNAIITNDPLPVIIADESQMVQLLQNLISNAIKFHGPVHPNIHISGETKKNEWIFTIRDKGIGIDSKDFERIFVIFQRLHKKGEYSGTGIGLAVCKKIIQRHGGKIWVESELKKGSTFHFSIPRNQNGVSTSKKVSYSN